MRTAAGVGSPSIWAAKNFESSTKNLDGPFGRAASEGEMTVEKSHAVWTAEKG